MRKKITLALMVAMIVALTVAANVWTTKLQVERVVITGNTVVERNEILTLAGITQRTELARVDLYQTRRSILKHNFIKDVIISREMPSTIKVEITERKPLAVINAGQNLFLDEEGVVVSHEPTQRLIDLPVLSGLPNSLKPGMRLDTKEVKQAVEVLLAARGFGGDLYHLISEVQVRDSGEVVLYSSEFGVPIMFGQGETVNKLIKLEAFWKEVVRNKGAQALQYIDLRYDNQVVVRWNPEHI